MQSDNQALRQKYNDLQQNNVQLEKQQNELKSHIEQMVQSEQLLQRDVRKKHQNGSCRNQEHLQVLSHFGIRW